MIDTLQYELLHLVDAATTSTMEDVDVDSDVDMNLPHHIPHVTARTLMEVGVVVLLFGLAMGLLAGCLNGTRGCEGCFRWIQRCCHKVLRRRTSGEDSSDEDGSSFIDDADSSQPPAPHVFESLNELVFFEAPQEGEDAEGAGFLASTKREDPEQGNSRLLIPTSMEKIFPDLLGPGNNSDGKPEASGDGNSDLREPLL